MNDLYDLQLFAGEANTQTTGHGGLSAEMKTYYGMELLENAKPQLVHNQFAATKPLPTGGGKTVEWRKFGSFEKALTPLSEGVTPDGSGISVSYITKELAQYGDYTTVSDLLDLTAIDDVVLEITDRHGSNMGLTLSAAVKSTVLNGKDCWLHKTNGLALPEWGYYFDENGIILHDEDTGKNGILKDGEDLYYYVDGIKAPAGMIKIGNDYYYANSKGKLIVNQTYYCSRMNGLMEEGTYAFDAEGKLIQGATDKNGIVKDDDGVLRYYVNGKVTYVGLIEIDGDFYYVRSNGEVVTDCVYWITWTHGLKEAGYYTFDENGKLTGTPKNGIVEEDGVLHYYVNGTLTYAGLIKIGDDYYYVNSKCEVVRDCDYYISWTHDLMPQGRYHFDADGKLTGSVAPLKNGIYEEDGSLYFYRNGERTYAGLIQIDGDYYYVRSTCEVVHDRSYYVYWTHGLMPEGYYNFDSAGRMILDSETE